MSKCEKQVITKLNKKLEKYGLTREELELKIHSASLYGCTVMKMAHCCNRDVATGKYECPYADVVNNTITCDSDSCISNSKNNVPYQHYYPQSMFNDCLDINDEDYPF